LAGGKMLRRCSGATRDRTLDNSGRRWKAATGFGAEIPTSGNQSAGVWPAKLLSYSAANSCRIHTTCGVGWLTDLKAVSQPSGKRASQPALAEISGRRGLHTIHGEARFRPCQPPESRRFPKGSNAVPEPYRPPPAAPPSPVGASQNRRAALPPRGAPTAFWRPRRRVRRCGSPRRAARSCRTRS